MLQSDVCQQSSALKLFADSSESLMPTCCHRWAVNISTWLPDQDELSFLLGLLPAKAQTEVSRYKFPADRQRALVSRLMQRKCLAEACSEPFSSINVQKTKGGKPFCASRCDRAIAPNLNFNISHEVESQQQPCCQLGLYFPSSQWHVHWVAG